MARIADMSDILFRGYIDETQVSLLREGMPMQLTLNAMKDVRLTAVLDYISPEGEVKNGARMFRLEASVRIPDSVDVRSGYSATATTVVAEARNVMSCNESCLEFDGERAFVYVLTSNPDDDDGQQFERRPVDIGLSDGYYIELKSGVKAGELLRGNIER